MGVGRSALLVNENQASLSIEPFTEDNRSFVPICNSATQVLENQTGGFLNMRDGEASEWTKSANDSPPITVNKMDRNIELWETISNLASANQQLATAHNLTLGHFQKFFLPEFLNSGKRLCNNINECMEKRKSVKHPFYSNPRSKENQTKATGKQNVTIKTMRKSWRRLKKPPSANKFVNIEIDNDDMEKKKIEIHLRKEIEDLNLLRFKSQAKNKRLTKDLKDQRLVIEQLTQAFESVQRECEEKEKNLHEVSEKLKNLELKSINLLTKLETFQGESSSANKIAKEEAEKSLILEARLEKQDEERSKQLVALDEATQQIRALESTIQELTKEDVLQTNESQDPRPNATSALESSTMEEFKRELMLKREARQRAIAAISSEMERLKNELEAEKLAHLETKKLLEIMSETKNNVNIQPKTDYNDKKTDSKISDRVEALRLSDLLKISDEITSDLWLQLERTDDLRFQLENDPEEHRLRINSLKRLSEETRKTLRYRKQQVNVLKDRLAQILVRLGDRCFLDESDEIKIETERQIEDIARSRNLCDERTRILAQLKDHCLKDIQELKIKLENSKKDNQNLKDDLYKTENKMDLQDAEILNLESHLGLAKADCRDLQNQMSVINSLFTQMLLSASSAEMDLDRLTRLLQENHDLISGMAKENGTEAAALPKLLLDIIEQVDGRENEEKKEEDDLQQENIAHNLPKVWRVLLELLRCHAVRTPESDLSSNKSTESAPDSCYKSVDTPTGPRLVISVSKTYIRLKELILEKKHLEKEMNRMKQLNTHLESKLSEQEKRLSTVSDELSKTWNIVGRMQAQHQQLHTHEKILRYELQQKRKMLQELKQELEYCKEKWESARQKNTNTEIEWRSLRREFAARKALVAHSDSFNNSGESGFSDEREESDEDENNEDIGKRIRPINSRRRPKNKDNSRAITPDTESEQPTDSEFSEAKLESTLVSGQNTPPSPESENSEAIKEDLFPSTLISDRPRISETAAFDPLDKALTNVIQQLIETDKSNYVEGSSASGSDNENIVVDSAIQEIENKTLEEKESQMEDNNVVKINGTQNSNENSSSSSAKMEPKIIYPISVFAIGPFPSRVSEHENIQFTNLFVQNSSSALLEIPPVANMAESTNSDEKSSELSLLSSDAADTSTGPSSSFHESTKELSNDQCEGDITISPSQATNSLNIQMGAKDSKEAKLEVNVCPSSSSSSSEEEAHDVRAARLRNLEEQIKWLVKKVNDTNQRSSVLNSRLEVLHETFGSTPEAPPMPDILPSFRLQTEMSGSENCETEIEANDTEEKVNDDKLVS